MYYCSDYGHPWYAKCLIWNGETRGTLYRNEYDEDGEFDDDDEEEDDYYDDEEDDEYEEDEYDDDEEW
ncbi:MAG: hypothetical protein LBR06_09450 [Bacteroidales bacterium]|nr:hypothetical protein [Bacteroidales bacterium]